MKPSFESKEVKRVSKAGLVSKLSITITMELEAKGQAESEMLTLLSKQLDEASVPDQINLMQQYAGRGSYTPAKINLN